MQTKEIKIGGVYAVKRGDTLIRFRVTEIVNRKTDNDGPSTNEIIGVILEDTVEGVKAVQTVREPGALLGPYEKYAELVERDRIAKEEAAVKKAFEEKRMQDDRLMFYAFVGQVAPVDPKEYDQLFRTSYGYVDISKKGYEALANRIRELNNLQHVADATANVVKLR